MKNVLITGGCGFIGSHFVNEMVNKYPDFYFINIDAMYYCASLSNVSVSNQPNYEFIQGNINDYHLISYLLTSKKIDTIVHFAAQSHVDQSFLESFKYTDDNVKGTHTLLEAVKNVNRDILFIHMSTDEVYGESDLDTDPKHEKDLLCPTNPYAASKAGAEMFVQSYRHSFQLKTIIVRGNNVYGPNQYPEKLIPKFIQALQKGEKCTIHGKGDSLRSFIHVKDVCSAIDVIIEKGMIGEIYNIGSDPENERSVMDVVKKLVLLIKNTEDISEFATYVPDRPFNDKRYFISNSKLKTLGWEPTVMFDDGLKEIIL